MATVRWSVRAQRDFRNILEGLSDISPSFAGVLGERILAALERLEDFPQSGRMVPEYGDVRIRELLVSNYRIVYIFRGDLVQLAGIASASQNLRRTLGRGLFETELS